LHRTAFGAVQVFVAETSNCSSEEDYLLSDDAITLQHKVRQPHVCEQLNCEPDAVQLHPKQVESGNLAL